MFNASISQQNIFGSGNALTAGINTSSINRTIAVTFTEPYYTVDGVSRTLEAYQRNTRPLVAVGRAVPVRRRWARPSATASRSPRPTRSTSGFRYEHTNLTLFATARSIYFLYVAEFGSVTNSIVVSSGWARDTRDDILYPTRGVLQVAGVEVGLPIVDLSYYKANYLIQWFWPVYGDFVLMLRGDVGYAAGYGGKPLPFYKVFYGGGVGSVRGYETATLGPRDLAGNPLGGRAQDHRQCRAVLSAPQGRQVGAGERVHGCRPDLRRSGARRHGRQLGKGKREVPVFVRRRARLELAGRAAQVQLRIAVEDEPGDRIQNFQFQVGSVF